VKANSTKLQFETTEEIWQFLVVCKADQYVINFSSKVVESQFDEAQVELALSAFNGVIWNDGSDDDLSH
jgi:hypothetical protein